MQYLADTARVGISGAGLGGDESPPHQKKHKKKKKKDQKNKNTP